MEEEMATLSTVGGEDEAWQVDLEEGSKEDGKKLSVVGNFLTASVVQFQAMRTTLANLWHSLGRVTITNLGKTISF